MTREICIAAALFAMPCLCVPPASAQASTTVVTDEAEPRHPQGRVSNDPLSSVSRRSLHSTLEDLTSIQPYSGWRSATTRGEVEAFAYVEQRLQLMANLQASGLTIEIQPFHTHEGIDLRETRLEVTTGTATLEVPASGQLETYDNPALALLSDTDGQINDSNPDPVSVAGATLVVQSADQLLALTEADVSGRIIFADYALFDYYAGSTTAVVANAIHLVNLEPDGIVLITTYSNVVGESHGTVAGDLSIFTFLDPRPPILFVRIEDMAAAGVHSWQDLSLIDSARLTRDVDVFIPGSSQNLIARIPGADNARLMVLGAHLDSPNTPGALDDGSGAATLLEVARVLDQLALQPPVDLYLVWFGSHERGLYGSTNFVAGHNELLDRSLAMLQVDCLSAPLDGVDMYMTLSDWSYAEYGDERIPWAEYLAQLAADEALYALPVDSGGLSSDNSSFTGFDVPNVNLIFTDLFSEVELHYAGHLHDPYDTLQEAERELGSLQQMARVALSAVLHLGVDQPGLRVTPTADRKALFLANHTEDPHMSPVHLSEIGMALAWSGFDVDMLPYGDELRGDDLEDADLVVVLPVHDFPSPGFGDDVYDEAWTSSEVDLIEQWVDDGGLLVLANSGHRLKFYNAATEVNEDALDLNAVAERFGVFFQDGLISSGSALVGSGHELVDSLFLITMIRGNGVPFTMDSGSTLAAAGSGSAIGLVEHGSGGGEVLVLADLGILGSNGFAVNNRQFFLNLADYARNR